MKDAIETLKTDPDSRRIIVEAWNVSHLKDMALPPCHKSFQFHHENGNLSLSMSQRSCDMFLGVPFNISSYALLLALVSQVVDMKPKEVILFLGDAHIYENHFEQVKEQLQREPMTPPTLTINKDIKNIDDFTIKDIELNNYTSYGRLSAPLNT